MEYILLRQHISALLLGHHQVLEYFKGDYTMINGQINNEISLDYITYVYNTLYSLL
jgi:hypothetical protein